MCPLFPPTLVAQASSKERPAPLHLQSFVLDTPHCKPQLQGTWTKAFGGLRETPLLDLRVILTTHLSRKVFLTHTLISNNLTLIPSRWVTHLVVRPDFQMSLLPLVPDTYFILDTQLKLPFNCFILYIVRLQEVLFIYSTINGHTKNVSRFLQINSSAATNIS